jgi:D-beta-D-heptose 7-phosphate kinase/D-beta-D-heptose 1-phosphate adenosyltransferase
MASGKDHYDLTAKQMNDFGVKHHKIIMGKPDVDLFVDDKAVSIHEWDSMTTVLSSPVVWTNGCYDILHVGHLRLFQHCRDLAKSCGGRFIIGIDSDSRVREMKGVDRPINNQLDRAEVLRSIKGVDSVYIYSTTEELDNMIRVLAPNVVVVGDDYRDKPVIGSQHAKSVEFFSKIQGYSTTEIVNRLRQ